VTQKFSIVKNGEILVTSFSVHRNINTAYVLSVGKTIFLMA